MEVLLKWSMYTEYSETTQREHGPVLIINASHPVDIQHCSTKIHTISHNNW